MHSINAAPIFFPTAALRGTDDTAKIAPAANLFGWIYPPRGPVSRDSALVVCAPLGNAATRRLCRQLAEQLALNGFWAMRFDYYGTGDSGGDDGDPDLVAKWLDSIGAAVRALRNASGIQRVGLVGLRLGAALALASVARDTELGVAELVLWNPYSEAKRACKEIALARQLFGKPSLSDVAAAALPRDMFGFLPTEAILRDLARLDNLEMMRRPVERVLILTRNKAEEWQSARELEERGVELTRSVLSSYPDMSEESSANLVPDGLMEIITGWLPQRKERIAKMAVTQHGNTRAAIGSSVRETPFACGPGGLLFGIVSEPVFSAGAAAKPAVILISCGIGHHVGPQRFHVMAARHWAALGHLVLRFDLSGLGDSPAKDGCRENVECSVSALDEVRNAMDALSEKFHASRFVLTGICSGAQLAFESALKDERVAGIHLVNMLLDQRVAKDPAYIWHIVLGYWRKWPSLYKTKLDVGRTVRAFGRLGGMLRTYLAAAVGSRFRRSEAAPVGEATSSASGPSLQVKEAFGALLRKGVRPVLVYSGNDAGWNYLAEEVKETKVPVTVFQEADHAFGHPDSANRLLKVLTAHLEECVAGNAAGLGIGRAAAG